MEKAKIKWEQEPTMCHFFSVIGKRIACVTDFLVWMEGAWDELSPDIRILMVYHIVDLLAAGDAGTEEDTNQWNQFLKQVFHHQLESENNRSPYRSA